MYLEQMPLPQAATTQGELDALLALLIYAEYLRKDHNITRIAIPLSEEGKILGANFYQTLRGRPLFEMNPRCLFQTWYMLWIERTEEDWEFYYGWHDRREKEGENYVPPQWSEGRSGRSESSRN